MKLSLIDRMVLMLRGRQPPRAPGQGGRDRPPVPLAVIVLIASVPFSCWVAANWLAKHALREAAAAQADTGSPDAAAGREYRLLARTAGQPRAAARIDRIAAALTGDERLQSLAVDTAGRVRIVLMTPDPAASRDRFARAGLGSWRTVAERRGDGVMIVERVAP